MKYWHATLFISIFLTAFTNNTFWATVVSRLNGSTDTLFLLSLFVVIILLTHSLVSLVSFRWLLKPAVILLLITSAAAAYFMDQYTVMIDRKMIINVFETDFHETGEYFNLTVLFKLILLGILPAYLVYRVPLIFPHSIWQGLWQRTLMFGLSFGTALVIILLLYQDYSAFGRNNRDLRHFINPVNYLYSLGSALTQKLENGAIEAQPIGTDATLKSSLSERDKPTLLILVVGETARAENFALNGYARPTNPDLMRENVVSFTNTWSCGTATATSLPCMFSHLTRQQYSAKKGRAFQRLPDVVQQAGVNVLWRENNTGCKGNCERIPTHELADEKRLGRCQGGHCFDEILLDGLQQHVANTPSDQFIILHQKGNHGPAYYLRYPRAFGQFKPVCRTNQLARCSQEAIVNAYDNALLYTDYLLAKTIHYLRGLKDEYNTAMIYISDHGESLGENNIYLHGMPYLLAPDAQKHIPLIVWLSDNYQQQYQLDQSCLQAKRNAELSHDHLFSSVLGLLEIQTEVYDQSLDFFAGCRGEA